jgi:hypothetical protein
MPVRGNQESLQALRGLCGKRVRELQGLKPVEICKAYVVAGSHDPQGFAVAIQTPKPILFCLEMSELKLRPPREGPAAKSRIIGALFREPEGSRFHPLARRLLRQ